MVNLKVCVGTSCHLKGSGNVLVTFQQLMEAHNLHDKVDLQASFCMGHCAQGVCVDLDGQLYSVQPETARTFFKETVVPAAK